MTALPSHSAFARPAVVERFLNDMDREPMTADSIVRLLAKMPVSEQIAVFRRVMDTGACGRMDPVQYDRVDSALLNFACEAEEALHEEEVRLHGPVEQTRYYL